MFTEHHYQSSDGLDLYYRSYGQAESAIVCLPGLTRNCKDFENLATHLCDRWRVITPDLRGRGHSQYDPRPANYHQATYVRDIWTLLDHLHIEQVTIIGTSLGGLIAMIMADQQPHRLRSVVINDIGPEIPPDAVTRILKYAGRTPLLRSWEEAAARAKTLYGLAYPNMPDDFWLDHARLSFHQNAEGMLEPNSDPAISEVLRKSQRIAAVLRRLRSWGLLRRFAGVNIDPWDSFRAVTMPCLLLHGAISDVLTVDIVERMRAVNPGLELVTIPGRGHAPTLDEPESRKAIDQFLLDN